MIGWHSLETAFVINLSVKLTQEAKNHVMYATQSLGLGVPELSGRQHLYPTNLRLIDMELFVGLAVGRGKLKHLRCRRLMD